MIDKNIKRERKEVNKPDFWIANRKEMLTLVVESCQATTLEIRHIKL